MSNITDTINNVIMYVTRAIVRATLFTNSYVIRYYTRRIHTDVLYSVTIPELQISITSHL